MKRFINWIKKLPIYTKVGIAGVATPFFVFIILNSVFPFHVNVDYSTIIVSNDSTIMYGFLTEDEKWRMKTELFEITPTLRKTILHKEDKYFFVHPGINVIAIFRAAINNTIKGKRTSGASTITMQVARLLEPKERTYGNKFIEMFRALQLEWKFSKKEILQLYLNLVPYGGNIEGIKAASHLYLNKAPNHLSIAEITALSIIPNRPSSLRPGEHNNIIKKERNIWLKKFEKDGFFPEKEIADALAEPVEMYRQEIVRYAPHFCWRLKSENYGSPIIYSTIDLETQVDVEKLVKDYVNRTYFRNIKNACAIVINNQTMQVEAYVGSADFNNPDDFGQVDGIRAVRSPGSTLKPLLFGLCFDKGIATPKTIISDVSTSFGGYEPENYDGRFNGNISLEYALKNSLNVPAVKMLNELETQVFVYYLKESGFRQIRSDEKNLGLSVVLGGCGVSLEELTRLYAGFANDGQLKRVIYNKKDTTQKTVEILSKSSAYMLTEILTQLTRPDLPMQWHNSAHLPKVAWKTGTSYGRKDAWSIGYNKKYTVGVWTGNFSGEGVPELTGAEIAAPLLFRIFNLLEYDSKEKWFTMPDELGFRYVCSETGKLPNTFCDNLVLDYYLPGISHTQLCHHMSEVYISPDSSTSYCKSCLPELGYIKAIYHNYSPEIITYFERNSIQFTKIPPHNNDCERVFSGKPPQIISPIHANEYFVNVGDSMEILLNAHVSADVNTVYWYINKKFYKSAEAGAKVFFSPPKGKVDISCSDDKGRNSDISITVKHVDF